MIYLFVLILLLLLSFRYDINGKIKGRDEWYLVVLVFFVLIAGLRYRLGNDTPRYIYYFYHQYPTLDKLSIEEYAFESPLYVLLNSFVRSFDGRFYVVQLIQSLFVNVLIFSYFRKHTKYIFTCVFFYAVTSSYFSYNMEAMRASMGIVIFLYANDYIFNKKWIKGYCLYSLAVFFHPQMIVAMFFPLLYFLRINKFSVIFIIAAYFFGFYIQSVLGNYLMIFDEDSELGNRALGYVESEKYGTYQGNLNSKIVHIFPNVIYGLACLMYLKIKKIEVVNKLQPFVILSIAFLEMQMNMHIMYRFVQFFSVYLHILYAETLVNIAKDTKRLNKCLAYVRAFVIFSPFLFAVLYNRYLASYRNFPYSSVIDRKIDKTREYQYSIKNRPPAHNNEY